MVTRRGLTRATFALCTAMLVLLALGRGRMASADVAAAKRAYAKGYKALQAGKYAKALSHYQRSYRLVPRPRTLFNVAVCQEKLQQTARAWKSYTAFLMQAEQRDVTFKARARDRIRALAVELRARVLVSTKPPGARVRVDGESRVRGRTPLRLELTPGEHTLDLSIPGLVSHRKSVHVQPKEDQAVNVVLVELATVVIHAEPSDARIKRVGGRGHARGTLREQVRPGVHEFVITRKGFASERLRIPTEGTRSYEQRVRLRKLGANTGTLAFRGVFGATVSVDGTGRSPASGERTLRLPGIATGLHRVQVSKPGHAPWSASLHVSPGEQVSVDLSLAKRDVVRNRWRRWGVFGLGVVSLGAGSALGVAAIRDVTSDSPSRRDRGKNRALIADGLFVAGVAAVIVGWRWARSGHPSSRAQVQRRYKGAP